MTEPGGEFLSAAALPDIPALMGRHVFPDRQDVASWFDHMRQGASFTDWVPVEELHPVLREHLGTKRASKNLGVDLPVWFGDPSSSGRVMIIALDPKRNQEGGQVSLGSVFSLHTSEGRTTKRNNYWRFIEPLLRNNFVYVTDVFKLYYESEEANGKVLLSNKDKAFIDPRSKTGAMFKAILEEEIGQVRPTRIITLGNEAAAAVRKIQQIDSSELSHVEKGVEYLFLPHISNTVTQSIKTIGRLFLGMGILNDSEELKSVGNGILRNRDLF